MHTQSGKVSSLVAAVALALLMISGAVVADAVSQAILGTEPATAVTVADQSWRDVSVLGTVATVGDPER